MQDRSGSGLEGAVVLVTGANGGLGTHFVAQALERGASKVYAAARRPRGWEDARIVPLELDVTDHESVRRVAGRATDVTVLVNNAGGLNGSSVLGDLSAVRELFEVNFWGALEVTNAFLPSLERSGGVVLNVLSVLSWIGIGDGYSASKAALWSATNTQRLALAPRGVRVASLHLGYTDTPMAAGVEAPKNDPADVVRAAYDGVEAGEHEVLADQVSRDVKQGLAQPIEVLYPQVRR
ncbi:Short-chain dehydrogenase [Nocardioides exalbidus]|uniref:Short-chain dehydrogenase n=2 Tax=Nocardioides exalbidus TaxID=402596 RepID=A0A1H4NDD1_9ACTN|nr:SDR family oxidoreductase [Nocardioides exalbidus]SEB92885.1 Short-chain dehydrogenase [Nocardioides exalbidus]